jgi:fatty-acyl-CoA synthase
MNGLMMDFPLTLAAIFRRAETLFGGRSIASRRPDRTMHRHRYTDFAVRARRLARALERLGVTPGDRVATLGWNHHQHLEAYFGIPMMGGVLHTLNLRLHPDELAYIVNHADDRVALVDHGLLPLWERVAPRTHVAHTIVVAGDAGTPPGYLEYEALLQDAEPVADTPDPDERSAAALCYTTGTTGRPKGVLYSHRALVLHTLGISLADGMGLRERDVVAPVVPMFHANAWGLPHAALMVGAALAMPGSHLDPASLVNLFEHERVTVTAGVPTIWMGVLQLLDSQPGAHDLSRLRGLFSGGSAAPQAMIEGFETRHGISVVQGWGMTETTPVGSLARLPADMADESADVRFKQLATAGRPLPFVEVRARNENGLVPWDGRAMGELEIRGPWVASAYYRNDEGVDRFGEDGWFKTGDIVTIDARGTMAIQDRVKDLIKSGGEWISSVSLECALMGHPAVAEAAVVPMADARWGERPLAAVVLKPGQTATLGELREFLAPQFPKFWLPDAVEFIDAIPRTSAGKFHKATLRERYKDYRLP